MAMIGGFDALRRSTPGGGQPQAQPVHHFKPEAGAKPEDPTRPWDVAVGSYSPGFQALLDQKTRLQQRLEGMPKDSKYYDDYLALIGQLDHVINQAGQTHEARGQLGELNKAKTSTIGAIEGIQDLTTR